MTEHKPAVGTKRLLVMAAGTGGHVYPALATARILQQQGWQVEWLGTGRGVEARLVPREGLTLHCIDIVGLRGKGRLSLLIAPWRLAKSFFQALRLLAKYQPHCVLGMGGFVAGPGGLASWVKGIPLVLHEQNAIPGLTNRLLRPIATRTLQAFEGSFSTADVATVGNPLRSNIGPEKTPHEGLHILVVGGSLGAMALNQIVPQALALLSLEGRAKVWHQTGPENLSATQQGYNDVQVEARVDAYIDNMGQAYAWADLVICRAGALTVSELAAAGMASILVPYPHAVDDHQTANSHILQCAGAAIVIQQAQLSTVSLSQVIDQLQSDTAQINTMAQAALTCAQPNAGKQVAQHCMEIARG